MYMYATYQVVVVVVLDVYMTFPLLLDLLFIQLTSMAVVIMMIA